MSNNHKKYTIVKISTPFQHLNIRKNIVTPFFELMKKNSKTSLTLNCLVLQYQICKKYITVKIIEIDLINFERNFIGPSVSIKSKQSHATFGHS